MRDQMDNLHAQHLKDKDEIDQLGQLYKVSILNSHVSSDFHRIYLPTRHQTMSRIDHWCYSALYSKLVHS